MSNQKLVSFHILERESRRNLITWTYPAISDDLKLFLETKSFALFQNNAYFCLRKNGNYLYIQQSDNGDGKFAVILITEEYDVNKYKLLCHVFSENYANKRDPVELVKLYLKLFTIGFCDSQKNGSVVIPCDLRNYQQETKVVDFINNYGLETIIIYTAILLKRRVLVYDNDVEKLQQEMLAICSLVPQRNLNEYLHPLIDNVSLELKGLKFFVAGTLNPEDKTKDLYDVFVDLPSNHITISEKSKGVFSITQVQKDVATFLMKLCEEELKEDAVIKEISNKTVEVLNLLKPLGSFINENNIKMITMSDLKSKNFKPKMENFLFHLALAEGVMIM